MLKITSVAWLGGGNIGFVEIYDEVTKTHKYYIKSLPFTSDSDKDAIVTARWGSKFPPLIGMKIIEELGLPTDIEY